MSLLDTIRLALRNLSQAKLRTTLTVLGVSIAIGTLSVMVSLGVGLEDTLVGGFMKSGIFDSITVTSAQLGRTGGLAAARGRRPGGPGDRGPNSPRGAGAGRQGADPSAPAAVDRPSDTPRMELNDDAIAKIAALPNVKSVTPNITVPVQLAFKDFSGFALATGVPMTSAGEGAFQTISFGAFFTNDQDNACMLSLDMARRVSDAEPKDLIGQSVTLTYAVAPQNGGVMQVQRIDVSCPVVGIVERESAPGLMGGGAVSALMIPLARARAIDAVQVTDAQSFLRQGAKSRNYGSLSVKVGAAQHTQDVEDRIKALGYGAFSLNDLVQGAKRFFIIVDILLSVFGFIALTVSSLGIVNTMVMSILERTREIGVMKAIGGSDRDVRKIFLIEASAIGVLGSVVGLAMGWVVGRIVNFGANYYIVNQGGTAGNFFSMPLWLIGGAIGFSIFVSLLAGSYPARRAARLDPIQALRHD